MEAERDLELIVLRALCQGKLGGAALESVRLMLGSYRWREPLHQALFEIILSIPRHRPEALRDLLPARLTRRGFPDFDFQDFFRLTALPSKRLRAAIQRLTQKS